MTTAMDGGHGNNTRHNWKKWADGKEKTLVKGRHFNNEPKAFRNQIIAAAKRYGLTCVTRIEGSKVIFTLSKPE